MISEIANVRGGSSSETAALGIEKVFENTLRAGIGWGDLFGLWS